jgi:hypothetical protein
VRASSWSIPLCLCRRARRDHEKRGRSNKWPAAVPTCTLAIPPPTTAELSPAGCFPSPSPLTPIAFYSFPVRPSLPARAHHTETKRQEPKTPSDRSRELNPGPVSASGKGGRCNFSSIPCTSVAGRYIYRESGTNGEELVRVEEGQEGRRRRWR